MGIDISKLTRKDVGRAVTYESGPDREHGHISHWTDGLVFVHFHRGSTAAGCKPGDLRFQMGGVHDEGPRYDTPKALCRSLEVTGHRVKELALEALDDIESHDVESLRDTARLLRKAASMVDGLALEAVSLELATREEDTDGE